MNDEQIKHMVERFLGWKLPSDFYPDGGVKFEPVMNEGTKFEHRHTPIGTNLLNYTQAKAMVENMLKDLPA